MLWWQHNNWLGYVQRQGFLFLNEKNVLHLLAVAQSTVGIQLYKAYGCHTRDIYSPVCG